MVTNIDNMLNSIVNRRQGTAQDTADQRTQLADAIARQRLGAANTTGTDRQNLATSLGDTGTAQARSSIRDLSKAATADCGDVFGNITYYDPRTGGFNTSLSGPQSDIERGYTQSEDARLQGLQDALAKQRYGTVPSEASIRSELTGLMSDANAQKMKDIQNAIGLSAIRSNRGGDYASLVKSINDSLGQQLPQTLLDARNQAVQEHLARMNASTNQNNANVAALKDPYAIPNSLVLATNDRNSATNNLASTLAANAGLAERATNARSGLITDATNKSLDNYLSTLSDVSKGRTAAQDTGFNDILSTLGDTTNKQLAQSNANNALTLNQSGNSIQQLIDALTQRQNIYAGDAARTQGAYATGMGAANTANAQTVSAIGKQAPNATILGNLADNFSITPDSTTKSKGRDNSQLISDLMDKINAG
jgi:hypothetical protein